MQKLNTNHIVMNFYNQEETVETPEEETPETKEEGTEETEEGEADIETPKTE